MTCDHFWIYVSLGIQSSAIAGLALGWIRAVIVQRDMWRELGDVLTLLQNAAQDEAPREDA